MIRWLQIKRKNRGKKIKLLNQMTLIQIKFDLSKKFLINMTKKKKTQ